MGVEIEVDEILRKVMKLAWEVKVPGKYHGSLHENEDVLGGKGL